MVKIESFHFGSLTIGSRKYDRDVMLFWDGEIIERESSHTISKEDLMELLLKEPEIVIIGNGTAGCVKIDEDVEDFARKNNIEFVIEKTPDAVDCFNKLTNQRKVAAIFHLTC